MQGDKDTTMESESAVSTGQNGGARWSSSLPVPDYGTSSSDRSSGCGEKDNLFLVTDSHDKQEQSMLCGIRGWRPSCLQPLCNMYVFTTLVGLSYFFSGMARMCLTAQLVSIERQFNIDSSQSGLFTSALHLGHASTVLLVGHFARSTNIPLAIGIAGIANGIFTMTPSILEIVAPYRLPQLDPNAKFTDHPAINGQYLCSANMTSLDIAPDSERSPMYNNGNFNVLAYNVLVVCLLLQGAVNSFRYGALPFVYVDDNILDKRRTGIYLAICFVLAEFTGPVGDVINSLLSKIPVDLSDTAMSEDDPRFVSAWWLGLLMFGALTVLFSAPIMLLPRYMVPLHIQQKALSQAVVTFAGGQIIEGDDSFRDSVIMVSEVKDGVHESMPYKHVTVKEDGDSQSDQTSKKTQGSCPSQTMSMKELCTDFPKSLRRIFQSPLFSFLLFEMTIIFIPLLGIRPFSVKYVMFEYNISMATTNLVKGFSSALTHILGTALGSAMSTRITTSRGYIRLILLTSVLACVMSPLYIVFGCDNEHVYGLSGRFGANHTHLHKYSCDCDPAVNLLTCGTDGYTYLSPCYAGCTVSNGSDFSNCGYMSGAASSQRLEPGVCAVDCNQNFIIFNVIQALQTFVFSINNMPRHLLCLRILNPEDRAFGNALMHFMPFLVSLPAPLLFGKWIESMCIVWSSDHCSLYNRDDIRYLIGGVEIVVSALTVITYFVMLRICRWMDDKFLQGRRNSSEDN